MTIEVPKHVPVELVQEFLSDLRAEVARLGNEVAELKEKVGTRHSAFIYEDDDFFTLQIELDNEFAVTLTYPKHAGAADSPGAELWVGRHSSRTLDGGYGSLERFREWAEIAISKRPLSSYGKAE